MNKESNFYFVMTMIASLALGFSIAGAIFDQSNLKKEAIDRGFAEYNATNGNWQWKESR